MAPLRPLPLFLEAAALASSRLELRLRARSSLSPSTSQLPNDLRSEKDERVLVNSLLVERLVDRALQIALRCAVVACAPAARRPAHVRRRRRALRGAVVLVSSHAPFAAVSRR